MILYSTPAGMKRADRSMKLPGISTGMNPTRMGMNPTITGPGMPANADTATGIATTMRKKKTGLQ